MRPPKCSYQITYSIRFQGCRRRLPSLAVIQRISGNEELPVSSGREKARILIRILGTKMHNVLNLGTILKVESIAFV
ncbi:hypothetical protein L9Z41_03235 [Leptospira noguchii]|uniref:hypothetical protein n=1 Tax=Leptospira noguchii TaxID=28182 RepID=UPI001F06744E|nr:hypothetical protein [Leptospira noguchii]MCH1911611.1 hypothetical protein [Leptospira noguchii]MCH1914689.1 hypothetical protein [Leptospira noguchii]UOG64601.1 hypothetical protein MAL04_03235 [Leptospira noguchii]UOG64622.1 hypothetical protein MAL04_03345 [Leptospira noguchii]UOG65998.1 hypothetical protein MAL04_20155 [Leptospira noguchii]